MTHRQLYAPHKTHELDAGFDRHVDNSETLGLILQFQQNARSLDEAETAYRLLERWQDRRYGHILPKW